jgi:ankyrin repeat protein
MKRTDFCFRFCFSCCSPCCSNRVMNQFKAAQDGDLRHLRVALTVDNVNAVDGGGWTALHWAAYRGHVDCVNYCIELGANVKARNRYRSTPLHYASLNGYVDVVCVLLDAGAVVDVANSNRWTPLFIAIRFKRVDAAQLNG